ncbi:MAG: gliding motility-associated C-terminal domain-containing protein [Saprospiraceae bacterium]|nr:gliding motility-associated C-terminal domain-containing protein [Saprospiraceae bacterium]MDW8483785.1 gliding motility-associated C-terminal domain-containing protein [Saprospiraceae bacterium]
MVDSNGCRASDSRLVVVDKTRFVYIPNVFVPGGGGENGVFYILGRYPHHVTRIRSLRVFDRWGSMVFERYNFEPNDPAQGWDGSVRGSRGLPGVYVYYAEIEFADGEVILYKGDVTIVR